MKGGVGKTTLTIGVADYLANELEKKVLVIDIDPQFNATQTLIDEYSDMDYFEDIIPNSKTINKLFEPQTNFKAQNDIPYSEDLLVNLTDNLDILCGDLNLVLVNKSNDYRQVKKLRKFINKNDLKQEYDYILIDCPPTLTIYTDSALLASDYYLIPNRIDRYSIIGISSLQTAIHDLSGEENHDIKCLGLIYTMVDENLTHKQLQIRNEFEKQKELSDIYIFSSNTLYVRDLQVGKQGNLSSRYKKSKIDISGISHELIDILEGGV